MRYETEGEVGKSRYSFKNYVLKKGENVISKTNRIEDFAFTLWLCFLYMLVSREQLFRRK